MDRNFPNDSLHIAKRKKAILPIELLCIYK